jgi:hypothetical protein
LATKNIIMEVKDIVGGGSVAKFSHYAAGALYYKVENDNGTYVFPVYVIEKGHGPFFKMEKLTQSTGDELKYVPYMESLHTFASDVGLTTFEAEMKAMMLMRWINKALKSGEVAKIS